MKSSARTRIGRRWGAVTVGLTVFGMLVSTTTAHATEPVRKSPASAVPQTKSPKAVTDDLARTVAGSGGSVRSR